MLTQLDKPYTKALDSRLKGLTWGTLGPAKLGACMQSCRRLPALTSSGAQEQGQIESQPDLKPKKTQAWGRANGLAWFPSPFELPVGGAL